MPTSAPKVNLAAWQEHFDFVLPRREMLRAEEIGAALGVDARTVHRLFETYENGVPRLLGHSINAGAGEREHRRYRRDSVILYLAERANYAPEDLRLRLLEVLGKQSLSELVLFQQAVGELIRRKQC
ncbi:MAG TPA: hypothetical protein VGD88_06160 [Opitutaceae bacterium]